MSTLLLKHADLLITMDEQRKTIADGGLFVRDNVIEEVGLTADLPLYADKVIDAEGMVVLPGLVNTHHHLYQTLTRAMAQDSNLFDWLRTLYPIWANLTGEAVYVSALVGLSELMLSGCTTTSDHLYIFPNDVQLEHEIWAARELGIRFHPTRGSMSLGESKGGLPPDDVVEEEDAILKDSQRVIEAFHDAERFSMCRVALAPCSPFSVTADLMRQSREMADAYHVRLHTHLAETVDEEQFCLEKFGARPLEYVANLGWVGNDVWFAHGIHVNATEIELMARTKTGVAHCPGSNMRLASGIAPVRAYLDAGVPVGIGVDGSASNDASHLLAETRLALLLQRVNNLPSSLTALEALELATLGGAQVLGRDDIGALAPNMAADFIGFKLETLDYAGCRHDPMAALTFCHPQKVSFSVINGQLLIEDGTFVKFNPTPIIRRHNKIAHDLLKKID